VGARRLRTRIAGQVRERKVCPINNPAFSGGGGRVSAVTLGGAALVVLIAAVIVLVAVRRRRGRGLAAARPQS
jgi:hypothetical protein